MQIQFIFHLASWVGTVLFPFQMVRCFLRADSDESREEEELIVVGIPVSYIHNQYSEQVSILLILIVSFRRILRT